MAINRQEVARDMDTELENLLELLGQLREADLSLPTQNPGWSVKDVIGHLANSAAGLPAQVQRMLNSEPNPGLEALNQRNAQGVESRKGRTIPELIRELGESHQRNLELLDTLTEDQLRVEGKTAMGEAITVAERFRRWGLHYREHGDQIRRATAR